MKVKVINKTSKGCTYKVLGLPSRYAAMAKQEVTWDEFNETYEPVEGEKYIFKLRKEIEERVEAKNKLFSEMMPWAMSGRVKHAAIDAGGNDYKGVLDNALMVKHYADEYHKQFGGSMLDFITEYRDYEKAMMETMMFNGIGVGPVHTEKYDFHEDKWSEDEKEKVKKVLNPNNEYDSGMSLGDMLKGKGIKIKE